MNEETIVPDELLLDDLSEQEIVLETMPEELTSARKILDQFYSGNGSSQKINKLSIRDSSGNELGSISYSYERSTDITNITRGDNMKYVMTYNDSHGRESIGIDGFPVPLLRYAGGDRSVRATYANGDTVVIAYKSIYKIATVTWTNSEDVVIARYKYTYQEGGRMMGIIDILQRKEYNFCYEDGNIVQTTENTISLNAEEDITARHLDNSISYIYNSERKLIKACIRDASGKEQECCHMGEAKGKQVKSSDTGLVESISFANGRNISYEYDVKGKVTQVTDSEEGVTAYTYDALGQLSSETKNGVSTQMTYDSYGNIIAKGRCDENGEITALAKRTYTYGDTVWHDKLTETNGIPILYDAGGNPLSYFGLTFSWERGQQLKSAAGNGKVISYSYNNCGTRISKTVNDIKHEYLLKGEKILRESYGTTVMDFLYDNEERICGLQYNGTLYHFYRNLQGDIIAITDDIGEVVANYSYDAWGVCTITSDTSGVAIAKVNPFRYRGYYFDSETGFYYLRSRYYDPIIGRFINADDPNVLLLAGKEPLGANLFTYCFNDPVNMIDTIGMWGSSIHNGKKQNNSWIYGTVKWAMDCGMCQADAEIVGEANNNVDGEFTGAGFSASRHFNRNGSGQLDSRLEHFQSHYQEAISLWRQGASGPTSPNAFLKLDALRELGIGLHSVQDYYAHLDYDYSGWWEELPTGNGAHHSYSYDKYVSCGVLTDYNIGYFDNEDYHIRRLANTNGKYFHNYVGRENSWRYLDTRSDTINYISYFIQTTGYECLL